MIWPCSKCDEIQKHKYGHYYGFCDDCPKLAAYDEWYAKQQKDQFYQKGKKRNGLE